MSSIRVNSLGGGRQSIYMQYNYPTDIVLFADTGAEPKYIYEQIKSTGIDFIQVSTGNIIDDVKEYINGKSKRVASLPFFTETGLLLRQCTYDYKIAPLRKYLRSLKKYISLAIGISLDEMERMKESNVKYIQNVYPLIENRITISDIFKWYREHNIEIPLKSACVICPFHNESYWKALKEKHPEEFKRACDFDDMIRYYPKMKQKLYISRRLKPLKNIDFHSQQVMQFPDLIEECNGLCGL